MANMTEAQGAVPGSPASIDWVTQNAVSATATGVQPVAAPLALANQGSAPATPTAGVTVFAENGILYTINPQGAQQALLGSQAGLTADVAVSDATTNTVFVSYTVPGGDPAAGSVYRIRAWGIYSTPGSGPATMSWITYWGGSSGTAMATIPALTPGTSLTSALWEAETELLFYSTTKAQSFLKVTLGTNTSTDAASAYVASPTSTGGTTVASSSSTAFDLNFVFGSGVSGSSCTCLGGYAERVA